MKYNVLVEIYYPSQIPGLHAIVTFVVYEMNVILRWATPEICDENAEDKWPKHIPGQHIGLLIFMHFQQQEICLRKDNIRACL